MPLLRRQRPTPARRRLVRPDVSFPLGRRLSLEPLESRQLLTVSWDGGGNGTSWSDPLNWSTDALPGATDDVVINLGTSTITHSSGTDSINSLTVGASNTLTLSGGTLNLASASSVSNLNQSTSSVLTGTGDVTVTGNLNWSNGTMSGSGKTILAAGATVNSAINGVVSRVFENNSSITITSGQLSLVNGTFNNNGTLLFNNPSTFNLFSNGTFNNAGTLTKQGAGILSINGPFHNSGTLDVLTGSLTFSSGSSSTPISSAAGTTLNFGGNYPFSPGAVLNAAGNLNFSGGTHTFTAGQFNVSGPLTVSGNVTVNETFASTVATVSGGTLTLNAPQTFTNLTQSAGGSVLTGTGDVTVTGNLAWSGGTMSGTGKTILAAGATVNPAINGFISRVFENNSSITITSGSLSLFNGTFNNNGTLLFNNPGNFSVGSNGTFNNAGTFTKQGAGALSFNGPFHNSGTLDFLAGSLTFSSGSSSTPLSSAAGTTLNFGGNYPFAPGAVLNAAGNLNFSGGTHTFTAGQFNVSGPLTVSGNVTVNETFASTVATVSGGTLTLNAPQTFTNLTQSAGGSVLTGTGDVTVTGNLAWSGGTMSGSGKTILAPGATVNPAITGFISRVFENNSSITITSGSLSLFNGTFNNNGTLLFNNPGNFSVGSNGTFNNAGTFTKQGAGALSFNGPFHNSGTLDVLTGTFTANTFLQSGGITTVTSNLSSSNLQNQGGVLTGTGTITGNLTNAAEVRPGAAGSPAILQVIGNFTQTATGSLNMDLAGVTVGSQYDRLAVSGTATLGGAVRALIAPAYKPEVGDSFDVVTATTVTGQFATITSTTDAIGLELQASYASNKATLVVVNSGEPGSEFRVNTYSDSNQQDARIAVSPAGNFVVVWSSEGQDGNGTEVYAQRYAADGTRQGSEFRVNTTVAGNQSHPAVAMDSAGNFVVVWGGVRGQRFNSAGVPQGSEFTVTTEGDTAPEIAMDAAGSFLVTWGVYGDPEPSPTQHKGMARRYNAAGTPQGSEFVIAQQGISTPNTPVVALRPDGTFAAAWSFNSDSLYVQRFNASGGSLTPQFLVDEGVLRAGSIALDSSGNFVVAYSKGNEVFARRFNAAGSALGSSFVVPTTSGTHSDPSLTMNSGGEFLIAWNSYDQDGSQAGVFGQRYNANGTRKSIEFQINVYTPSDQQAPAVGMDVFGNVVAVWQSQGQDSDGWGVYGRQFQAIGSGWASIAGRVFGDANGNASQGPGELGQAGWTVYDDANNNGVMDPATGHVNYNSVDVPVNLPDLTTNVSTLEISGVEGVIADVNINFTLQHTYDGDLVISLVSPQGKTIRLTNHNGGTGNGFLDTTLDDQAATSVLNGSAPYSGSYRPVSALAQFIGQNPNGQWKLIVADEWGIDSGVLEEWSLDISTQEARAVTNSSGNYVLNNLSPGTHRVRLAPQAGFEQTYPAAEHLVNVAADEQSLGNDFGAWGSSISGSVFVDVNSNLVRDGGEPGIPGWVVYDDVNGNGVFDGASQTMTPSGPAAPIPDVSTVNSSLEVSGYSRPITDLNVRLTLQHTFDADLRITLIGPDGTSVILSNRRGGSGDNFVNTRFDDQAAVPIVHGLAPFTASFRPDESLAAFRNKNANGTWTLQITDLAGTDVGTLESWSLEITTAAEPSVVSDAQGNYRFDNLAPGTVRLREQVQSPYTQTGPAGDEYVVNLVTRQDVTSRDFGNITPPPTVDLNGGMPGTGFATTWAKAGAVPIVDAAASSLASDNTNLVGLTATIVGLHAGDVLDADVSGTNISKNYVSGVLHLTGSDTLANYQLVLRTLTYNNTLGSPVVNSLTVEIVASDGVQSSNTAISTVSIANSTISGRRLFYNQSGTAAPLRYDGNNAAINANDDLAIATDKVAYLPGSGAATFANVSSYTKGINGIMIDLHGPHGPIAASDFIFRVGNNNTPSSWVAAPAPSSISVRAGAGISGSDRIVLTWANGAITKKWLEVIVLAGVNTGLAQKAGYPAGQGDVFFFGNALANSGQGDSATQAVVNTTDELAARNNPAALNSNIPITNLFDYNRDGQVNTTDALAARNNPTNTGNVVRLLNIANPPAAPEAGPTTDDSVVASAVTASAPSERPSGSSLSVRLPHSRPAPDSASAPAVRPSQLLAAIHTPAMRGTLSAIDWALESLELDEEWLDTLARRT